MSPRYVSYLFRVTTSHDPVEKHLRVPHGRVGRGSGSRPSCRARNRSTCKVGLFVPPFPFDEVHPTQPHRRGVSRTTSTLPRQNSPWSLPTGYASVPDPRPFTVVRPPRRPATPTLVVYTRYSPSTPSTLLPDPALFVLCGVSLVSGPSWTPTEGRYVRSVAVRAAEDATTLGTHVSKNEVRYVETGGRYFAPTSVRRLVGLGASPTLTAESL